MLYEVITIECDNCGNRYLLTGHMCPDCHTYYEKETAVCPLCGEAISLLCSHCNASNWGGDENCKECGASLDILEHLQRHSPQASQERLREHTVNVSQLKEIEEEGSKKRMAELMAIEEERQIELSHLV